MLNENRIWGEPQRVNSLEELAERLAGSGWVPCTAWELPDGRTRLLNDSFGDGGEFAVIRLIGDEWRQVESITFSWCSREKALAYLEQATAGEFDRENWVGPVDPRFHPQHETCPLCA